MSDQLLARARLTACRHWPHATSAILSLVPVEKPGLGTCAVDQFYRLYYDPAFLAKCSPDEAAGVVLHEVSHCLLNHAQRAGTLVPKNDQAMFRTWNMAADAAINYSLQQEKIALPKGAVYPITLKLDGNQSAEWYFQKLKEQMREEITSGLRRTGTAGGPDDSGQGDAGQGHDPQGTGGTGEGDSGSVEAVDPLTSGSCADGRQRPWEAGPPVSEEEAAAQEAAGQTPPPPGLAPHEQQQIVQQVAEALKSRGTQRGGLWGGFVEEVLNPKIDPRRLLAQLVRSSVDQIVNGCDDWTYRRPSRRQGLGGTLRPSGVQIVPRITVLIDSSGSMGSRDLGLAVGVIGKVLSGLRMRDGVHVIVGDTCAQLAGKVFDPKKVAIQGRGGTDMSALIEHAAEQKPTPDLIICATDGYTDYPRQPVGPRVVAALTRADCASSVPSWIKTVVLA